MADNSGGILALAIADKHALHAAYIPFVRNGGVFIPTKKLYKLGDEVFMLLSLMDSKERIPIAGRVVWITPQGAQANRTPGIGVQFSEQDRGATRNVIESLLVGMPQGERPTRTM